MGGLTVCYSKDEREKIFRWKALLSKNPEKMFGNGKNSEFWNGPCLSNMQIYSMLFILSTTGQEIPQWQLNGPKRRCFGSYTNPI